ncbi:MAG: CHC2 zinc finger domain-containing protein [Candidatus Nanoarchaeia archaeon]|nr:CHC2 zinc finger domain-containing protein [Candidatus Nanoarchaeia archaeon]
MKMIEDYKKIYNQIYSKINLEIIFKQYNIDFKTYHTKKGKEFMCLCPFHDDTTPSFSIQQKTGVYNCFVCGGGDFIKFIKKLENLNTTKETIEFIKHQVGITENSDVFSIISDSSFNFFDKENENEIEIEPEFCEVKLPKSEPAEKFFDIVKKRVCIEDVVKYGMRYCIDDFVYHHRLIIPIYMENKLVSFAARDMSGKSDTWLKVKNILKQKRLKKEDKKKFIDKYLYKKILYPCGTPMSNLFFNWDEAIKHKEDVFLCEGIFDALKILKFGYNALALLSCHLNSYKAKRLAQNFKKIFVVLDNDNKIDSFGKKFNPGQEAAQKMIKEYFSDIDVFNLVLPEGKDPDDCSEDEFNDSLDNSKKLKNVFTLDLH